MLRSTGKTQEEIIATLGTRDYIFLCVGPNVWGKGFTRQQAIDACKAELGKTPDRWLLFAAADPWASISDMGDITYTPRPDGVAVVHDAKEWMEVDRKEPRTKGGR